MSLGERGVFLGLDRRALGIVAGRGVSGALAEQVEPAHGLGAVIGKRLPAIGDPLGRVALGRGQQGGGERLDFRISLMGKERAAHRWPPRRRGASHPFGSFF